MAKRSFSNPSWTPIAVAHTNAMTANACMFLNGGSSTQRIDVSEIEMGGAATASAPMLMLFGRDSTVAATSITLGSNGMDAALDPATAALAAPAVSGCSATTMPQRSSTLGGLLTLTYNALGGIVRWVAPPGSEIRTLGNTASLGELSLSAFTGGTMGLHSAHIIYEPL
jgi:hypothetical protein